MTSQDLECNAPDQSDDDLRAIWARENSDRIAAGIAKFETHLATLADDLTDFTNVVGIDEFLSALWAMRAHTRRFRAAIDTLTDEAKAAEQARAEDVARRQRLLVEIGRERLKRIDNIKI